MQKGLFLELAKNWAYHRSTRKSTAAAKEAREAKEAAAAVKATPGWVTTFTLNRIQYVLKDTAGHPVSLILSLVFYS